MKYIITSTFELQIKNNKTLNLKKGKKQTFGVNEIKRRFMHFNIHFLKRKTSSEAIFITFTAT